MQLRIRITEAAVHNEYIEHRRISEFACRAPVDQDYKAVYTTSIPHKGVPCADLAGLQLSTPQASRRVSRSRCVTSTNGSKSRDDFGLATVRCRLCVHIPYACGMANACAQSLVRHVSSCAVTTVYTASNRDHQQPLFAPYFLSFEYGRHPAGQQRQRVSLNCQ